MKLVVFKIYISEHAIQQNNDNFTTQNNGSNTITLIVINICKWKCFPKSLTSDKLTDGISARKYDGTGKGVHRGDIMRSL